MEGTVDKETQPMHAEQFSRDKPIVRVRAEIKENGSMASQYNNISGNDIIKD